MKKNKMKFQPLFATTQEKPDISRPTIEDGQLAHLAVLRRMALYWMERLASFNPYLVGEVLEGTATYSSDIRLQIFCDDAKEFAIFLLNAGIQYEVSETLPIRSKHASKYRSETLSFIWPTANHAEAVGIHFEVYAFDELRRLPHTDARGKPLRINHQKVVALIKNSAAESVNGSTDTPSTA